MIERSISFGPGEGLVGTLCLPDSPPEGGYRIGQVLFNAGIVHRVGPHRMNVRLGRDLAERGIPSLRFDLAGLGDSARPAGDCSFEQQAVVDIRAALDEFSAQAGVNRFALFGFCSGGCHAFAAAPADPRIAGVILYDTYVYRTVKSRLNRILVSIRRQGFARFLIGWLRRLPGGLARRLSRPSGDVPDPRANEAGYFRLPSREEFARWVRALHERNVKIGIMFSGGYQDYNYREQFADAFSGFRISEHVAYDYFPAMDHTATVVSLQTEFMNQIEEWVVDLDRRERGVKG